MIPRLLATTAAMIAALAASLSAQQTKVVPAGMDFVEGPSLYTYPFGRQDGALQILYDKFQILLETPAGHPHAQWGVPQNPLLAGLPVCTQALGLPSSGNLAAAAVSNGEAIRIGSNQLPLQKAMSAFRTTAGWFIGTTGEFVPVVQFEGVFP